MVLCAICYDDDNNKSVVKLHCGHKFHVPCFKKIINHADKNNLEDMITCPYCRSEIKTIQNKCLNKLLKNLYIKIENIQTIRRGYGFYTHILYGIIQNDCSEKIRKYPDILRFNTYQNYLC